MKSQKKKSIETIKNSNEITEKIIEDYSLKQEKKRKKINQIQLI